MAAGLTKYQSPTGFFNNDIDNVNRLENENNSLKEEISNLNNEIDIFKNIKIQLEKEKLELLNKVNEKEKIISDLMNYQSNDSIEVNQIGNIDSSDINNNRNANENENESEGKEEKKNNDNDNNNDSNENSENSQELNDETKNVLFEMLKYWQKDEKITKFGSILTKLERKQVIELSTQINDEHCYISEALFDNVKYYLSHELKEALKSKVRKLSELNDLGIDDIGETDLPDIKSIIKVNLNDNVLLSQACIEEILLNFGINTSEESSLKSMAMKRQRLPHGQQKKIFKKNDNN